ncbi:MAG: hypothetical protein IJ343_07690 [Clostridia bacterium]|nr:hypothetical protein [Clostridia bacterium]
MNAMFSVLLSVLLTFMPVLGVSGLEETSDWAFLTEWGVLTEEEAAILQAERTALENGRELVRTAKVNLGPVTDETGDVNTRLIEDVGRVTLVSRSLLGEEHLSILLDGKELLSFGVGGKDGLTILDSNLLPGPVSLSAEDIEKLPTRLATALQTNGVISREDAMRFGMLLAAYSQPAWLTALSSPAAYDTPDLDLKAWDAVVSAVSARREFAAVQEQPADCDEAAQVWTLAVTQEDVRDVIIAGLQTLKDNAATLGEAPPTIDLMLMQVRSDADFLPLELHLTGYVDAADELVRLEIDVFEKTAQAADDQQEFMLVYNRRTTAKDVTHELLMGEDQLVNYVAYVNTAPHAMYAQDHLLTFGTIAEDGTRVIDTAAFFCCVVNDTVPGLKSVTLEASVTWPSFTYMSDEMEPVELRFSLGVDVKRGGVSAHFPTDGASIRFRASRKVGGDVLDDVHYAVSYDLDGVDLTGTERLTVRYEGETMLECEAELRTQQPSVSLFDEPAIRLSTLTDEELAAWTAQVQALVEAWAEAQEAAFGQESEP